MTEPGVEWSAEFGPAGVAVRSVERLAGGLANGAWMLTLADGGRAVVKSSHTASPGLFAAEAAGLEVLRTVGGLRTPEVIDVGAKSLTLEALEPQAPDTAEFWEAAGRAVAGLHEVTASRYGWDDDGWLGLLPQENAWDDDGHDFFATHRILRYLREPNVLAALDRGELAGLERLCGRLPDLVPAAPASLTHGDLWRANVIATAAGEPVFIDPAVSWMWAEVDLSMMFCTGGVPDRFFDAYHEMRPPVGDWRERMPLLNLRELLCMVAHFGPGSASGTSVERIREAVKQFG